MQHLVRPLTLSQPKIGMFSCTLRSLPQAQCELGIILSPRKRLSTKRHKKEATLAPIAPKKKMGIKRAISSNILSISMYDYCAY